MDFVRAKTGAPLTLSRFYKDRMRGIAPRPVRRFGNRDLFEPDEILAYGNALITPSTLATTRPGAIPID